MGEEEEEDILVQKLLVNVTAAKLGIARLMTIEDKIGRVDTS